MSELNEHGEIDLSYLEGEFAQAKEPERVGTVPDGKYIAKVESVSITKAKREPHHPLLKWQLRILEGEHKDRMLFRNNMLATRENLAWLKGDLKTCGMEISKINELKPKLEKLLGHVLEVTVRSRTDDRGGSFTSVFLNKRLADYQGATEEANAADPTDIPF
jgi:hypothetical protein